MIRSRKAVAARQEPYYQPSFTAAALALLALMLLAVQARAEMVEPRADIERASPQKAPPATPRIACRDEMDFEPDDGFLPSPFDADDVAFHARGSKARLHKAAAEITCGTRTESLNAI